MDETKDKFVHVSKYQFGVILRRYILMYIIHRHRAHLADRRTSLVVCPMTVNCIQQNDCSSFIIFKVSVYI